MLSAEEKESIIAELNTRFTELRSLILTVGSILGILIAALSETGVIGWAVDYVEDDDTELNPYDCEEDWAIETDHYIIESDAVFNIYVEDFNRCNNVHTVMWNITMNDDTHENISIEFRNELYFSDRFTDLEEGMYHTTIEVMNGTMDLYDYITIDFEFDELEHENAVYGCTDDVAENYDYEATHDDGTCQYPVEEEDNCSTAGMEFYDVTAYWSNNTTFTIMWDADVTLECTLNATVRAEVFHNGTLVANRSLTFTTFYQAWDYMYINISAPQGQDAFGELEVRVELRQWEDDPSIIWENRVVWS